MKTILTILFCFYVVNLPFVKCDCGWDSNFKLLNILDTDIDKQIFDSEITEDFKFQSWSVTLADGGLDKAKALKYFAYDVEEKHFMVATTKDFGTLNKDAYTGTDVLQISIVVVLQCDSKDTENTLYITINNTNQNAPKFSKDRYTYSLPMPIMPKTDISLFGDEITATDIDFSTSQITFTIEPADFDITSIQVENKKFRAVFSANKILTFTDTKDYTLIAQDSGTPPKETSVTVTLTVDSVAGLDVPQFSNPYYTYDYTSGNPPTLTPTSGGSIAVETEKSDEAEYSLNGEYKDLFNLNFDKETKIFTIEPKSDATWPEDASNQIILTLTFTTEATTNAIILISAENDDSKPLFSSDYYTGTYDIGEHNISWDGTIEVTGAIDVTISGDKSDLFTIDQTTYEVSPIKELSRSDFNDNSYILLTLIASSKTSEAHSVVLISLPNSLSDEFRFDSPFYKGDYSVKDKKGVVSLENDIGFPDVTDFSGITIEVDEGYRKNFKIEPDASAKWVVTVISALDPTVLDANTELSIPITATKEGESIKISAILILKLPEKVEIKFSKPSYIGHYIQGADSEADQVVVEDISIEGAKSDDIDLKIDDYDDYLELKYNGSSSTYFIHVKKSLDPSLLDKNTELIITMTASLVSGSSTGNTVLLLKLPGSTSPLHFKNKHYAAEYIVNSESEASVVYLGDGIDIDDAVATDLKFTFEDYDDYFELVYNESLSRYTINVKKLLDPTVLDKNTELIITITASLVSGSSTGNTVLLLKLPGNTSPLHFKNKHYAAEYKVNSESEASVVYLGDGIDIDDAAATDLKFTFEDYDDYFELVYNESLSRYTINVKKLLDPTVLDKNTELIITITASLVSGSSTGNTVLLLKLPGSTSSLHFKNEHYAAKYIVNSESEASVVYLGDGIDIDDAVATDLKFTFVDYDDYFELVYNESLSRYTINVKKLLDPTVLDKNTELIITITASLVSGSSTGNTVLLLKLPGNTSHLHFKNKHYAAEYKVNSESEASVVYLGDGIDIEDAAATDLKFTFEDYDDYFELVYNESLSRYTINVKKLLDPTVLDKNTELIITITASLVSGSSTGNTVLLLKLPGSTSSLHFKNEHYAAKYIVNSESEASVVYLGDGIDIDDAVATDLKFTFEDYDDYFELVYNESLSRYTINVKKLLDPTVLDKNTELIITITASLVSGSSTGNTVLLLKLPGNTSPLHFKNKHYAAEYKVNSESEASVVYLGDGIDIDDAAATDLKFTFEDYDDYFELVYNESLSRYTINVKKLLDPTVLDKNTELIITITASLVSGSSTGNTVLLLKLPGNTSPLHFKNKHYAAEYKVNSESEASVVYLGDGIDIDDAAATDLKFTFEDYDDYFELVYNESLSRYTIKVKTLLDPTVLDKNTELIITITASLVSGSSTGNTVLLLKLPGSTSPLHFKNKHYAAEYIVNSESEASVVYLGDGIDIDDAAATDLKFTFEDYDDYFELVYNESLSRYTINVKKPLDPTVLDKNTELIITITASLVSGSSTGNTVLLLKLPGNTSPLHFKNKHYTAEYIVKSESEASVVYLGDGIDIDDAVATDLKFTFDDYDDYFELVYNGSLSRYTINVKKPLDVTVLDSNTELIIAITASSNNGKSTGSTVLFLKLPVFKFSRQHYTGVYSVDTEGIATVDLDSKIAISNADPSQLEFVFEGYNENFGLKLNPTTLEFNINVNIPLDQSVLDLNTELTLTLTASNSSNSKSANTVLVLRFSSEENLKSIFDSDYYEATYKKKSDSEQDAIILNHDIKVKSANFATKELTVPGYEKIFAGTCSSSTLKCEITVTGKLNDSILSDNYQLLITLVGSSKDGSSTGKSVLLLKLPQKDSTFNFTQQYYSASYAIQNSDAELATVELIDTINFDGADPSELTVILDQYSEEFSIRFESKKWNLRVVTNLNSEILSKNTELVIPLTAIRSGKNDYSKATLAIKLPDKTTLTFLNVHYSGSYIIDDKGVAKVELTTGTEIQTTSTNVQITLDDYAGNFEVALDSDSKWNIKVKTPLDPSIFSNQTELKLLMTVTKAGVEYGAAALTIKLPDPSFSRGFYIADYFDDGDVKIKIHNEIEVYNVNAEDISINLSDYEEYFKVAFVGSKWVLSLFKPLPASITQNYEIILTDLLAVRKSDSTQLTTSTLVVKLPNHNTTGAPEFSDFTFYGSYNNVTNLVELSEDITFTNLQSVEISKVSIEDKSTCKNFKVVEKPDNIYEIGVQEKLSPDVLSSQSSIVCTLVATSNKDIKGYATLVINLPKTTREKSIDFQHEDAILYTATYYDNGNYTTQVIVLKTNITDIDVDITNDLNVDKKYFKYVYAKKYVTILIDSLPNDILEKHPVIPLKIAITDKSTGDTVHAVMNIEIKVSSGGGEDSDSVHTGLLVAVIILACLLVGAITATILLWYFKIRGHIHNKMDEEMEQPTKKPELFTKNLKRKNSAPLSSDSLRRPTGLPIGVVRSDSPTEDTSSDFEAQFANSPTFNLEKKVSFDDNVSNMHDYDGDYDGEESSGSLKNVADRRPTKFIFAPSISDEDTSERRESSDYVGIDPDKKKAVVFDEKVERMQIDVVDDDDDDNDSEGDDEYTETYEVTNDSESDDEKPTNIY